MNEREEGVISLIRCCSQQVVRDRVIHSRVGIAA